MEEWLNSVLSRIADGSLLPASYFVRLDCDAALDARDGDAEFDVEWVRQSEEVKRRWAAADVSGEAHALAEDIRRESFLAVSRATRQYEIASYVSDDFDRSAASNTSNDSWACRCDEPSTHQTMPQ